jgi:hypothetical protein
MVGDERRSRANAQRLGIAKADSIYLNKPT